MGHQYQPRSPVRSVPWHRMPCWLSSSCLHVQRSHCRLAASWSAAVQQWGVRQNADPEVLLSVTPGGTRKQKVCVAGPWKRPEPGKHQTNKKRNSGIQSMFMDPMLAWSLVFGGKHPEPDPHDFNCPNLPNPLKCFQNRDKSPRFPNESEGFSRERACQAKCAPFSTELASD